MSGVVADHLRKVQAAKVRDAENKRTRKLTSSSTSPAVASTVKVNGDVSTDLEYLLREQVDAEAAQARYRAEIQAEELVQGAKTQRYEGTPIRLSGKDFESGRLISDEGATSQVTRGKNLNVEKNGVDEKVVLKRSLRGIHTDEEDYGKRLDSAHRETVVLGKLADHDAFSRLFGDYTKTMDNYTFLYLVMEKIDGKCLSSKIGEDNDVPEVLGITRQLLDAVGYMHERGIAHRDLKPSNVMITEDGSIRIIDMGAATNSIDSTLSKLTGNTLEKTVLGTPKYVAPETRMGNTVRSSDIYSLGIMLYDLLSDEPVPETTIIGETYLHLDFDSLEGSLENKLGSRSAAKAMCHVVKGMTRGNVSERYQSVEEVGAGLERFVDVLEGNEEFTSFKRENLVRRTWDVPEVGAVDFAESVVSDTSLARDRQKIATLENYLATEPVDERDTEVIRGTISRIREGRTNDEVQTYIKRFNEENPELIFGLKRRDIHFIYAKLKGLKHLSLHNHFPDYNKKLEHLDEIKADPAIQGIIEHIGEKGLGEKNFFEFYRTVTQNSSANHGKIDPDRHKEYMSQIEAGRLDERVEAIKDKFPKWKQTGPLDLDTTSNLALLLMMEDEGLKYSGKIDHQYASKILSSEDGEFGIQKTREVYDENSLDGLYFVGGVAGLVTGTGLTLLIGGMNQYLNTTLNVDPGADFTFYTSMVLGIASWVSYTILGGKGLHAGVTGLLNKREHKKEEKLRTKTGFDGYVTRAPSRESINESMAELLTSVSEGDYDKMVEEIKEVGEQTDQMLTPYELLDRVKDNLSE